MPKLKSTTRRTVTTRPPARDIHLLYDDLSIALVAVMRHPECPHVIFEALGEAADTIINHTDVVGSADFHGVFLAPAMVSLTK